MMDSEQRDVAEPSGQSWRGPTIAEIARESGLGTASVDRVLNERSGVKADTRRRVLAPLDRLKHHDAAPPHEARRRIAFISDSGVSFNHILRPLENPKISNRPLGRLLGHVLPIALILSLSKDEGAAEALPLHGRWGSAARVHALRARLTPSCFDKLSTRAAVV